jgi:hypothetical protein
MNTTRKRIAFSLVIAAAACFLPYLFPPGQWDKVIRISLWLALVWFVLFLFSVIHYRKKGLWFLVGLPLVPYWPFVLFMLAWGCSQDARNCP